MITDLIMGAFLGICSYTDVKKRAVYTRVLIPFLVSGILTALSPEGPGIREAAAGTTVGLFILILSAITRGAIGEGDGIVLMITGLYTGFMGNVRLLCLALFLSACVSAVVMIVKKCGRNTELPFMPFLMAAYIVNEMGNYVP